MFPGATVFPEGLSIGSTFDMELVNRIYSASAQEARAVVFTSCPPLCWNWIATHEWDATWKPTQRILTSTRRSRKILFGVLKAQILIAGIRSLH